MKTIVWFSNVLVFLCFSDEGPYTKHSNPSRPPDGALAIRRQSIPGTKHCSTGLGFIWRCGVYDAQIDIKFAFCRCTIIETIILK